LFLPSWLPEHLKLLDTYPKVGLVTGFYIRSHMRYGTQAIQAFAGQPDVKAERGFLIPRELEQHYIDNMGRTWETYQQEVDGLDDLHLTYHGVEALASAGHHQFVAHRQVLLQAMPGEWSGQLMGKVRELEITIDALGYLRLSTCKPVTHLLGNVISPENTAAASQMGLTAESGYVRKPAAGRVFRVPVLRRLALAVYNRLHAALNS